MSKAKSAAKPHKRGFRLIFQAGGPAFLRSAALFPAHKCVEVCACQIESSVTLGPVFKRKDGWERMPHPSFLLLQFDVNI